MGKVLSTIYGYIPNQHKKQYEMQLMKENEISERAIEKIEHDHKWMIEKYGSKPTKYNPYHYLPIEIQSGTYKHNHLYAHILDSNTIKLRIDINATNRNNLKKLIKNFEGATNIHTLSFSFETLNEFSQIERPLTKLNTQNLHFVSLYCVKMTSKDLVRIIHKCDKL